MYKLKTTRQYVQRSMKKINKNSTHTNVENQFNESQPKIKLAELLDITSICVHCGK